MLNNDKWGIYTDILGYVVVLPINDKREHDRVSMDCECGPQMEVYGDTTLIVHNAFDFRDVMEWLEEENDE